MKLTLFSSIFFEKSVGLPLVVKENIIDLRGVSIVMRALKDSWKKVRSWANRNTASIFTGWIVALIMTVIIIVKDTKHSNEEIGYLVDKVKLTKENHELAQTSIMQFEMINDLLEASARQRQGIGKAAETINGQATLIQRLAEYLKSIGHWPPKINPPKPTDPDKWI